MDIIFEDEYLLVVNKPAGVPSQPDFTGDEAMTDIACAYLRCYDDNLFLLHRLDRPVGGVMVFAKDKKCAAVLNSRISGNTIDKRYLAVVLGEAEKSADLQDYLIKNNRLNKSVVARENDKGTKLAKLQYSRLTTAAYKDKTISLLQVKLETGRHHQIRVQLAHAGLPIWGDNKYAKEQMGKEFQNIGLFAHTIAFRHPKSNQWISVTAAVPKVTPFDKFELKFYKTP